MATERDMQAFVVAYQEAWASREPGAMRALRHLNPDYRAVSPEDWRSLGVAAPAPLPDRFDAVAAWARPADPAARASDWS